MILCWRGGGEFDRLDDPARLLPRASNCEVAIEFEQEGDRHLLESSVSLEIRCSQGLFEGFPGRSGFPRELREFSDKALKLEQTGPICHGAVARNDLIKVQGEHSVERLRPLLYRATRLEIDVRITAIEEEIARVEDAIFDEEHHEVASCVAASQVEGADRLAADPQFVPVCEQIVGSGSCG